MKKLLNSNKFRKQCIVAETYLRKIKEEFNEKRLLKVIEDRLESVSETYADGDEIEFIEYIDDQFELENDINAESVTQDSDDNPCQELKVEVLDENSQDDLEDDGFEGTIINDISDGDIDSEFDSAKVESDDMPAEYEISALVNGNKVEVAGGRGGRRMCPICGKLVVNLKPHIDTHDEFKNRRKPYKCTYCKKEFLQRAQFDGHVNKEHTGEKPFKCDQCDKSFHGRPSLRMHKIQHSKVRRFTCEYCDKSYLYAHHLSHHRYTHTQKRLFRCEECDYTNVHRENLKRHILSKHTKQAEKPHQCKYCSRAFNGRSNLLRHIRYVHKNDSSI